MCPERNERGVDLHTPSGTSGKCGSVLLMIAERWAVVRPPKEPQPDLSENATNALHQDQCREGLLALLPQ